MTQPTMPDEIPVPPAPAQPDEAVVVVVEPPPSHPPIVSAQATQDD